MPRLAASRGRNVVSDSISLDLLHTQADKSTPAFMEERYSITPCGRCLLRGSQRDIWYAPTGLQARNRDFRATRSRRFGCPPSSGGRWRGCRPGAATPSKRRAGMSVACIPAGADLGSLDCRLVASNWYRMGWWFCLQLPEIQWFAYWLGEAARLSRDGITSLLA